MKKLITIAILVVVAMACKKEKQGVVANSEKLSMTKEVVPQKTQEENKTNSSDKEYVTAKIDGVNYSFSDKVKVGSTSELSHVINGSSKESKGHIILGLNLDKQATGTFELDNNTVLVYHADIMFHEKKIGYNWNAKESVPGSSGRITITKNTATYLEGTFLFEGVGATKVDRSVKKVTEGRFRVKK